MASGQVNWSVSYTTTTKLEALAELRIYDWWFGPFGRSIVIGGIDETLVVDEPSKLQSPKG